MFRRLKVALEQYELGASVEFPFFNECLDIEAHLYRDSRLLYDRRQKKRVTRKQIYMYSFVNKFTNVFLPMVCMRLASFLGPLAHK